MWEKEVLQISMPVQKGRRCSRHRSREFTAACDEGNGEAPFPSIAQAGSWWSTNPSAAHKSSYIRAGRCSWRRRWLHWKPVLEQALGRTCDSMQRGAHAGASSLSGIVTPSRTHAGTGCSWRTTPLAEAVLAAHGKDSHSGNSWMTVFCGRDPTLENGKALKRNDQ